MPEVLHRSMSEKISDPTFLSEYRRLPVGSCVSIPIHFKVFIVPFLFSSVFLMLHAQLVSKKINKYFVYSLESRGPVFMNTLGSTGKIVPPSKRISISH